MDEADKTAPPEKSTGDYAHALTRAGLSAIPVVGGPATVLFAEVLAAPLAKRREEFLQSVLDELRALRQDLEDLARKPCFVSALMQATQAAMRNHHEEKLNALRNAVLNAALPPEPEQDRQGLFLSLIDYLSPLHIRALMFLHEFPDKLRQALHAAGTMSRDSTRRLVCDLLGNIETEHEMYSYILASLTSIGLSKKWDMDDLTTLDYLPGEFLTPMGKEFMQSISSPLIGKHVNSEAGVSP